MKSDTGADVTYAILQRQDDALSTAAEFTQDTGEEQNYLQEESEEDMPQEDGRLNRLEAEW
eukprot:10905966-Alexandrium_andersonii.AAC.1